jgi:hypothetical protein
MSYGHEKGPATNDGASDEKNEHHVSNPAARVNQQISASAFAECLAAQDRFLICVAGLSHWNSDAAHKRHVTLEDVRAAAVDVAYHAGAGASDGYHETLMMISGNLPAAKRHAATLAWARRYFDRIGGDWRGALAREVGR